MTVDVSDHALVRYLERAYGVDCEQVRATLAASLERGVEAAARIGTDTVTVRAHGLLYVVVENVVVTVMADDRGR